MSISLPRAYHKYGDIEEFKQSWDSFNRVVVVRSQQTFVLMTSFVFKTSWSRRKYSPNSCLFRRRLQDVLMKTNINVLVIRLQDVFKTFCQDIFKTSSRCLAKTSSWHLQDLFKTFSRRLAKISSRCFQDVPSS